MTKLRIAVLSSLFVLCLAPAGDAKITLRPHEDADGFFFHANYSSVPFSPSDGFGLEIWNCANGEMPVFIADVQPVVACGFDDATGLLLAERIYAVALAPGACVDHGASCYFRDPDVPSLRTGIRYLRIRYARQRHGNRVWLQSYGDLSGADQANMLIVIKINGGPRAALNDTFVPLPGGGWFSPF
jgi:hypothetical protein